MSMTSNQPSVVDEREFSVRRTIHIAASVDRVWSAITEPAHISKWFGRAELDGTDVGATGSLTWETRGPVPLRIEERVELHSITYRWSNDDTLERLPGELDEEHSTVFTFTLEPVADGTELTVIETGFDSLPDSAANLESHRNGWNGELDKLVLLLES
jgi:uncharacterized protein YndB with AHSA1/START domain